MALNPFCLSGVVHNTIFTTQVYTGVVHGGNLRLEEFWEFAKLEKEEELSVSYLHDCELALRQRLYDSWGLHHWRLPKLKVSKNSKTCQHALLHSTLDRCFEFGCGLASGIYWCLDRSVQIMKHPLWRVKETTEKCHVEYREFSAVLRHTSSHVQRASSLDWYWLPRYLNCWRAKKNTRSSKGDSIVILNELSDQNINRAWPHLTGWQRKCLKVRLIYWPWFVHCSCSLCLLISHGELSNPRKSTVIKTLSFSGHF